ncbi:MAG TPA: LacI family DNA-binding transcriptional regulator, partial [Pontiella sp.]|nr:LacI family DNA-binding transcriptional regulator [Pontiella sp.]
MATLYDVCEKSGVSTATVSRVINGSELVTDKTRDRVLKAIKELNYSPSHAARMLAGQKTDTIGIVLPVIANGYIVQVLSGIDHVAREENLKMMTCFYHDESDLESTIKCLCGEGRASAIILMNPTFITTEKVRELAGDDMPIILLSQVPEVSDASIDCVLIDNYQGAYCAVEHLLEGRPESLLLLTGAEHIYDSQERLKGAQQAIQDASYDMDVTILSGDFRHDRGRAVFEEHVKKEGAFPDAIFAFNDDMALGVLDVLNKNSKVISEDVQLIGFDNTEIAEYIGLSTIRVPMKEIGEEAGRLAANRIKNKDAKSTSVTFETSLEARKTTAPQEITVDPEWLRMP